MRQLGGPRGDSRGDEQNAQHANRAADGYGGFRALRREFLGVMGVVGLGGLFGEGVAAEQNSPGSRSNGRETGTEPTVRQRVTSEFQTRRAYSRTQLITDSDTSVHASNDRLSEEAVIAKFGKSLEHNETTGLPTTDAYSTLVEATETGGEAVGYEEIPQADEDSKPLVQPETAWTYMTEGGSTAQLRIAVPPAFDDPETGAEMVELYWRALTRDVDFREYGDNHLVEAAAEELDSLDAYNGPGADSTVTPDNVFRGVTPGATTGPYVSQFLWKDRNLGGGPEDQKIQPQVAEETPADYMTTVEDWRKVQNGVVPSLDEKLDGNEYAEDRRHIINGRDMCERVHDDPPFRQIQKAAQVLVYTMQAPLDEGIPYVLKPFRTQDRLDSLRTPENETPNSRIRESRRDVDRFLSQATLPFNDFGPLYIEKKAVEATEHAQKAAWHKKWNVHRRLRPEEYGGRIEAAKSAELDAAEPYPIPEALRTSEAIEHTTERFDSYLLPQAYAEGSPTHPSYPAGHSVVAGAGVTVLKALFDGDHTFAADEKVVPTVDGSELVSAEAAADSNEIVRNHNLFSELTVRGELNKLATNMALGRNWAGIHYRSDGIEGLRLGESVAIDFLEDQLSLPAVDGVRLSLTTFDGEPVTIAPTV
jgi:hypothetical protein